MSLKQQGIACVNQTLFDYQALASSGTSKALLTKVDMLIFVSVAAVEFAQSSISTANWQYGQIFAVGKATQNALLSLGISQVITPSQENSEGLLALPSLTQDIKGKTITIVRGNGGREHLADSLKNRGAKVSYLESYQRVWRVLAKDISKQWYQQQINCIVVTSNAILEKLVQLMITHGEKVNNQQLADYWQKQCIWVVASKRIANKAKALGIDKIVTSAGASDLELTQTLQALEQT
ncbi:MAG: uroporphyrinogen-III synthase [Colwellia sp.]|nr:uroporphyrinogen-III synthase [Colwellia sp.]MCW8866324.1 uroporphyrinogen-III synthase [Colwellia sp.]MCW9080654.1 uroporphyrinogen-III synthase [Colwellia sp.]